MSIKVFCDIADLKKIKKFNSNNFVKGFTTNPSLMRKAGAKDYKSYSMQILKVCNRKPISFEVFADSPKLMIEQGVKINKWGKNIYVKVRSTGKLLGAKVKLAKNNSANVELDIPEDGISPGQACVFYNKDSQGYKVLGGGWITE